MYYSVLGARVAIVSTSLFALLPLANARYIGTVKATISGGYILEGALLVEGMWPVLIETGNCVDINSIVFL